MDPDNVALRRTINRPLILLYGIGTILGAGIYVLTGEVVADAGLAAPLSFLIAAVVAVPTAYSYAKLSARYPRSAGEAVYVQAAFSRSTLTVLTAAMVVIVGLISAATITRGFVGYFNELFDLPPMVVVTGLVIALTLLAAYGVLESVGFAALIAVIEIIGLGLVVAGGFMQTDLEPITVSLDAVVWPGVLAGAFLAFYAFIGFEDIVNMAEETHQPERAIPFAIYGSLLVTTILYIVVVAISVLTVPVEVLAHAEAPMARVVENHGLVDPGSIAVISMLAVVNGALVQMIMASRVIYGTTQIEGRLDWLGRVNSYTRTPVNATLLVGLVVLVLALSMDVRQLASLTSIATLVVFSLVNISYCRILWLADRSVSVMASTGVILCLALMLFAF